jgi:hypothetical protein
MDFITDHNPSSLYSVFNTLDTEEIPEYVKQANQMNEEDVAGLRSIAFADILNREFPIHTKEATWLSAAYAKGLDGIRPKVYERIKAAAKKHGISEDLDYMESKMDETVKSASQSGPKKKLHEDFALTIDFEGDVGVKSYYPIKNAAQTVDSSMRLMRDEKDGRIPIEIVKSAAVEIVKAAKVQGVFDDQLPQRVWSLGAERVPDFDKAAQVAEQRRWVSDISEEAINLYKEVVKSASEDSVDNIDRWVECWNHLDKLHNVKYSSVIIDPYQAFFSGEKVDNLKRASEENIILQDVLVPVGVFTNLPKETIEKHFNKYAAETIIELQKKASENTEEANKGFGAFTETQTRTLLKLLAS